MRSGLLLTNPPPSFLLQVSHHRQQWTPLKNSAFTPNTTSFLSVNPSPLFLRQIHAKNRRWDSNAETFRTQNFNFSSIDEDDDDEDDTEQWFDILEKFIDGVWIFKVFRSFGWMLPAIISSLLLATGSKAFLLALALPLGQSALSLAFQKVWGKAKTKQKRKGKTKKKPRARTASKFDVNNEKEEEEEIQGSRREKMGYQKWVAGENVSAKKSTQNSRSFGGWDQLDMRATRNSTQTAYEKRKKSSKSKLSRRERSDTPLLLRLLIAVFPFLASWTRML